MAALFVTNEGTIDRIIRVLAGVSLLALTVVGPKSLWGLVGLVPLTTGLLGTCPLYSIFGLNTCPVRSTRETQS